MLLSCAIALRPTARDLDRLRQSSLDRPMTVDLDQ
jgi:hypothetical protein